MMWDVPAASTNAVEFVHGYLVGRRSMYGMLML